MGDGKNLELAMARGDKLSTAVREFGPRELAAKLEEWADWFEENIGDPEELKDLINDPDN